MRREYPGVYGSFSQKISVVFGIAQMTQSGLLFFAFVYVKAAPTIVISSSNASCC